MHNLVPLIIKAVKMYTFGWSCAQIRKSKNAIAGEGGGRKGVANGKIEFDEFNLSPDETRGYPGISFSFPPLNFVSSLFAIKPRIR